MSGESSDPKVHDEKKEGRVPERIIWRSDPLDHIYGFSVPVSEEKVIHDSSKKGSGSSSR